MLFWMFPWHRIKSLKQAVLQIHDSSHQYFSIWYYNALHPDSLPRPNPTLPWEHTNLVALWEFWHGWQLHYFKTSIWMKHSLTKQLAAICCNPWWFHKQFCHCIRQPSLSSIHRTCTAQTMPKYAGILRAAMHLCSMQAWNEFPLHWWTAHKVRRTSTP